MWSGTKRDRPNPTDYLYLCMYIYTVLTYILLYTKRTAPPTRTCNIEKREAAASRRQIDFIISDGRPAMYAHGAHGGIRVRTGRACLVLNAQEGNRLAARSCFHVIRCTHASGQDIEFQSAFGLWNLACACGEAVIAEDELNSKQ